MMSTNRFKYPRVLILDVWIEEIIEMLAALQIDMSMDIVSGIGGELLTDANVNILVTGMTAASLFAMWAPLEESMCFS